MVITSCYCLLIAPQTNQTEFSSLWYNAFSKGMNTFALFGNETGKTLAGLKPEHLYRWYFCSIRKYIEFRTSVQLFSAKNCSSWKLYVKRRSVKRRNKITKRSSRHENSYQRQDFRDLRRGTGTKQRLLSFNCDEKIDYLALVENNFKK